ncbi:ectoine/hydroxyectoine ABC transporter permease subunit EhuC [Pseudomonas putida]|uniref:ectoine/hydroxyectoine ABC transporter permease subunit EhuC n=1 Tax=Pseudomonas putida TaxID=303 RepID=UPI00066B44AA|nr:ectoine/hydroxyectoine ABC transporter permease subunit EhuC [Pseudomonas putida]ELU0815640.1 ectoine/hydroxyectoine ABC transporter permease subunit EhuC [Pseudomonas putida]MCE0975489.1 ectoine/hydroxyectoine ABC transporter permease subunit EhuC [Pseudomonas putida]MDD2120388.1 ectoine/hydroxyectoine ABC transporter permease subunit EhuC [Pseudomonas putida]UPU93571.1 ectoine/hydroxyectoine ABC transporter permease subunit EhuC [Pseudomonas putida]HDS1729402.1 ectoine/hydroxyectoine ABC 
MADLLPLMLQGAGVTLQVTFFGSLLAIIAATLAALGKMSTWRPLRWFCVVYIEIFRGTSLLVQLFWLFFVLPLPPFNLELSPYTVAIVGLGLHIGAYGAEIMRGAINSVAKGQYEACTALNFGPFTRFRRIILPQALLAAMGPGTNLLIELLKNTSLVSLITLADLSFRARQLDQATFETLKVFALALLMYFVMAQAINLAMRRLERHLARGRVQGSL